MIYLERGEELVIVPQSTVFVTVYYVHLSAIYSPPSVLSTSVTKPQSKLLRYPDTAKRVDKIIIGGNAQDVRVFSNRVLPTASIIEAKAVDWINGIYAWGD